MRTTYLPDLGREAARIIAGGGTIDSAARVLGVDPRTLRRWRRTNRECAAAIESAVCERLASQLAECADLAGAREVLDLVALAFDRAGAPPVRQLADAIRRGLADGRSQ
jgi:transposase-like protein